MSPKNIESKATFDREDIRRYLSNVSMRGEGVMNSMTKMIEGNKLGLSCAKLRAS